MFYDERYEPEVRTGYCTACKKECFIHTVDDGIGPYEFWGFPGVDHHYVDVSDCCEEPVTEEPVSEEPIEELEDEDVG